MNLQQLQNIKERALHDLDEIFAMHEMSVDLPALTEGTTLAVIRAFLDELYPGQNMPVVEREGLLE